MQNRRLQKSAVSQLFSQKRISPHVPPQDKTARAQAVAHKQFSRETVKPTLLSPAADLLSSDVKRAIAFPIAPDVQRGLQVAGYLTSK